MEYCVELNGGMYALPPYTNNVRSKINRISADDLNEKVDDFNKFISKHGLIKELIGKDAALEIFGTDEVGEIDLNLIKELIGKDAALEIFGTDEVGEIDLNLITICYVRILRAYEKDVAELEREDKLASLSQEDREFMMEFFKNAGNIQELDKMLKKQGNKQRNVMRGAF